MESYPTLKNLLISVFSVDVGLEESEELAALERVLSDPTQRTEIEAELRQLFQDATISWSELLENDEYVVYPADDDEDAKEYVIESLWNRVFPNASAP
jgi:lipopolysaccharide assembly outer membrane protein LptD (OstA)